MIKHSNLILPSAPGGIVSHTKNIGVGHYCLDDLYSPDTAMKNAEVLRLGPMISKVPGYWWDRSRYQNHATITGATWIQMPNGLWVLSLDGIDDYLNLGNFTRRDRKSVV